MEERKKRLEERKKQRKEDRRNAYYRQKEEEAQRIHEEQLKKGDLCLHMCSRMQKASDKGGARFHMRVTVTACNNMLFGVTIKP